MITQQLVKPESLSLYTISEQLSDAIAEVRVDEETGELIGIEAVEALTCSAHDKILNMGKYIQNQSILMAAMKEAKKNIEARIKSTETRIEGLKRLMGFSMQQLNARRIEEGDIAISLRKTSFVDVYDDSLLADEFFTVKTTKTVSKTAIQKAISAGTDVQGARIEEKYTVQIK